MSTRLCGRTPVVVRPIGGAALAQEEQCSGDERTQPNSQRERRVGAGEGQRGDCGTVVVVGATVAPCTTTVAFVVVGGAVVGATTVVPSTWVLVVGGGAVVVVVAGMVVVGGAGMVVVAMAWVGVVLDVVVVGAPQVAVSVLCMCCGPR